MSPTNQMAADQASAEAALLRLTRALLADRPLRDVDAFLDQTIRGVRARAVAFPDWPTAGS